jgi:hypothetical protein
MSVRECRQEMVRMNLRCMFLGHRWGPVEGTGRGSIHTCSYCGKTKHIGPEPPAETHDGMGLHH